MSIFSSKRKSVEQEFWFEASADLAGDPAAEKPNVVRFSSDTSLGTLAAIDQQAVVLASRFMQQAGQPRMNRKQRRAAKKQAPQTAVGSGTSSAQLIATLMHRVTDWDGPIFEGADYDPELWLDIDFAQCEWWLFDLYAAIAEETQQETEEPEPGTGEADPKGKRTAKGS